MSHRIRPPCWLVVALNSIALIVTSLLIIRLDLPDSLLFLFTLPCVLAAFFYSRRVYLAIAITVVAAAVWVTSQVSSDFAASLGSIAVAGLSTIILAEGVHALVRARSQVQESLNRQNVESQRLAEMGIALLDCDQTAVVFDQLGASLSQIAPDTVIVLNETTPDQRSLITRHVLGLEGTLFEQAEKLFGFRIVGRTAPISQKLQERFYKLRLLHLAGGFTELLEDTIPTAVGIIAEKLFSLHDVYTIGITGNNILWGNVVIITRRPGLELPAHLIEAMVYQSFLALSRIAATRQLVANEKKYRLLFQYLSAGYALYEVLRDEEEQLASFRLLEGNPAFERLTGLRAGNVVEHNGHDWLPEAASVWTESYNQIALTGEPAHFEVFNPVQQRWFQVTAYSPEAERLAVMLYDITDYKQAQEALQQSEERYRALFDQSAEGIYLHDLDGTLLDVNHIACLQMGYTREELLMMTVFDLLPDQSEKENIINQWRSWKPEQRFSLEAAHRRKNGEVFPVEISTGVIQYTTEGVSEAFVLSTVRDITERKQTEVALARYREQLEELVATRTAEMQAQYAQLSAILRSAGDGILMTDAAQRIRYVNPGFTKLTGYEANELLEQELHTLDALLDIAPRLTPLMPALLQGKPWQGDVRIQRKDGRYYDAAFTVASILDDAGQVTGHVFTHHDISQSKDLERARSQFIANVSHQFRTPLTALKTSLHVLQNTRPAEHQQRTLHAMAASIDWLTHLVQDTLEITVLDSGTSVEAWALVSLPDIVAGVLEGHQQRALAAGVNIEATPFPTLPAVKGDARRLAQAINELVENAIVFTPPGGQVTIDVGLTQVESEDWVSVTVRDTGPGIPQDEMPRLFERFFRGRLNEAGHTAGVGLGLPIAQKIAEAHGGHMSVESTEGHGSAFTLWLHPARQ